MVFSIQFVSRLEFGSLFDLFCELGVEDYVPKF